MDKITVEIYLDGPRETERIRPDGWNMWDDVTRDLFIDAMVQELINSSVAVVVRGDGQEDAG